MIGLFSRSNSSTHTDAESDLESRVRQRRNTLIASAAASTLVLLLLAPDAVRNLLMLAWIRNWTIPGDAGLPNLEGAARWMITNERSDSILQAQAAGLAHTLGMKDEASAALERARNLAPIAGQCNSANAMLLEQIARPLVPRPEQPRVIGFSSTSASRPAVSQMRSIASEDGAVRCLYLLTISTTADSNDFAAMHASLAVQPGNRYRIENECYATGNMQTEFRVAGIDTRAVAIDARDGWTTVALEFQPQNELVLQVQLLARAGSGRITCRENTVYQLP